MIVTRPKPLREITGLLESYKHIFLVGCGDCATKCNSGGEPEVHNMERKLARNGKQVTGAVIARSACNIPETQNDLHSSISRIDRCEAVLVLACGAGTQSVNTIIHKPVIPALNTMFLGSVKTFREFEEQCQLCNDCILGRTGGICPRTSCPKSMSNGPCGGVTSGKCEVDPEKECAWILIYNKLRTFGQLHYMEEIYTPRDYSLHTPPQIFRVGQ